MSAAARAERDAPTTLDELHSWLAEDTLAAHKRGPEAGAEGADVSEHDDRHHHRRGPGRRVRRRRRWVFVAAMLTLGLVGAAAGCLLALRQTGTYEAEAVVLVTPLEGNPFSPTGQGEDLVNLETEAQVVESGAVAKLVARRQGQGTAREMLDGLTIAVPPNTQILRVRYEAESAQSAESRAQAFAVEYLTYRSDRAAGVAAQQQGAVRSQIEEQQERLDDLRDRLDRTRNGQKSNVLRSRVTGAVDQLSALRTQLAQLSTGSIDPGQVVTAAAVQAQPSPATALSVMGSAGLLTGAAVPVGWHLLRRRARRTIRTVEDVEECGVPVAGHLRRGRSATCPLTGIGEVRAAVLGSSVASSVLVAAAGAGVERTSTVSLLAEAAARSRVTTMVIDLVGPAEPADPGGDDDVPAAAAKLGLAEVLGGERSLDEVVQSRGPHLLSISPGRSSEQVDDLVISPAMRRLLDECTARAHVVLVDAGGVRSARALAMARICDSALLEVAVGIDGADDVTSAAGVVASAHTELLGAVLVEPDVVAARGHDRSESSATGAA